MKIISILFSLFILLPSASHDHDQRWGQLGHYVTGEIADLHLTETAKTRVYELLGNRSMALATVWMDDIRSDSSYDYTSTWHWVTIPDNKTYAEAEKNPDGDVVWALETLISELKEGNLGEQEEAEKLKMVMHMIGDIHQPMHVGDGTDQGGNQVRLQWMGENSNLHRVWDSDIINSLQFSFTELAHELNKATPEQVDEWQQSSVSDWAYESVTYRDQMYDLPDNMRIGYEYRYNNKKIVFHRLLQAGIRMAGVLNDIYGEKSAR